MNGVKVKAGKYGALALDRSIEYIVVNHDYPRQSLYVFLKFR